MIALSLVIGCGAVDGRHDDDGAPVPADNASIRFVSEQTLKLAPRQVAEITIATDPPERYRVSFLLIGSAFDASLDKSSTITESDGHASVKLRAPNQASTFALRASLEDGTSASGWAELSVAVSDMGFGALEIQPTYMGPRSTETWEARVVAGISCDALAPSFPEDPPGALKGSGPWGEPVIIKDAPVGPNLAVFVRGGHYMWGCSNFSGLVADETSHVIVHIADKPIDASGVLLDIDMVFAPNPTGWEPIVQSQRALLLDTFFGSGLYATAGELLDATMMQLSDDPDSYAQASGGTWGAALQAHLDTNEIDLHALLFAFAEDAVDNQPDEMLGRIQSVGQSSGQVLFTLERINHVSAQRLGVPSEYVTTLTVDAQDIARLGGNLFWLPTRYIGALIEDEGLAQFPSADFATLLSELAMCTELTLEGFDSCTTSCMQALCADALAYRWALALDASVDNLQVGEIPFEASGQSHFDDAAMLTGFSGSWLGEITIGPQKAKLQGAVSAQQNMPPTP